MRDCPGGALRLSSKSTRRKAVVNLRFFAKQAGSSEKTVENRLQLSTSRKTRDGEGDQQERKKNRKCCRGLLRPKKGKEGRAHEKRKT